MTTFRTALYGCFLGGLALVAAGCGAFRGSEATLTDHMYVHFSEVGEVQTALVLGDLESARRPARWLAEHAEHPNTPPGAESIRRLRSAASTVANARTLNEASRGTAAMATACGACHLATGADLRLRNQSLSPAGTDLGEHMVRHLWAADRMWEGLLGPSDELWQAGATALSDDPLFLAEPHEQGAEVDRLANETHQIATEARRATRPAARSALYGRLLGACAGCHGLMGVDWRSQAQ